MADFFILDDRWKLWPLHPGAWICDCGPFLGEWPPYAPLTIPLDAGEVQLLVCLPPPDGDLTHLLDGSYPTAYSWPRRVRHSPTDTTESGSYEANYGLVVEEPIDPYIPPAPGTVPGGDAPLMGASASSNSTFNSLNSAAGPFGCRRTFSSGLPANFLASPAGPDYAAGRDSYWSFKPNPHTFSSDSAAQAAFTAYLATVPAGHRLTVITWHEPEDNVSKGEFTLAEWKATVNKVAQLVQATGRPELRAAVCFMSYWTFDSSGYGGMDFLTGINWANIDSIGLDPYRYNPGDKSMEQMLTVGNSGRSPTVQSCMSKLIGFGKPFFIAEWGCTQTNITVAEKARWISEAYAWFKSWNASHGGTPIEAAMYFNNNLDVGVNPKSTWELSGAALTAFAAAVADAPAAPPDSSPPTDTTPGDGYNGGTFIPSDAAPVGAHLYLIWYDLEGSESPPYPSAKPLSIVPQGMVAGSTGPARGSRNHGHWSDWIPYDTPTREFRFQLNYGSSPGAADGSNHGSMVAFKNETSDFSNPAWYDPASYPDAAVVMQSQLESIRTGGGLSLDPFNHDFTKAMFAGEKINRAGGIPATGYDFTSWITQGTASYVDQGWAYELDFSPTFFESLTYGDDWLDMPFPGGTLSDGYVQYRTPAVRAGWADWVPRVYVTPEFPYTNWRSRWTFQRKDELISPPKPAVDTNTPIDFPVIFRFAMVPEPTVFEAYNPIFGQYNQTVSPTAPAWREWGDGDTAAILTTHAVSGTPGPDNFAYVEEVVIPLSDLGDVESFSVFVQPEFLGPRDQPIPEFELDIDPDNASRAVVDGAYAAVRVITEALEGIRFPNLETGEFDLTENTPAVIYNQPDWRYWVPGPIPAYIPIGSLSVGAPSRNPINFW